MPDLDFKRESFTNFDRDSLHLPDCLSSLLRERDGPLRILDLGCGSGAQVLHLAQALPQAQVMGVDVSPMNIRAAREAAAKSPFTERVAFEEVDYFAFQAGQWDAIFSESTLHLIPDTKRLFAKISEELTPGGILAATVPHRCWYNALLIFTRRIYRAIDVGPVRWGALQVARRVYPGVSMDLLNERLGYMRVLPHFLADAAFLKWLSTLGLRCLESHPLPRMIGKPAHSLFVFSKSAS